ncbi:P-type conjugative transfer ATPase TrbB [Solemya pervernicosa gill symbiont]|uniref:P-type conjugative transfer ATPase TrbB n=1 Tax=Solemya pervernicosa gill symbiont TaxID=642797 RepID=A0A1T2KZE7_9GAMM|nr:P-type conjugative transfer ATPase TrbB [Solemya pervernicosa gill symbiont]OOZ38227.1 P-type conjugative transfer ATPase TrbB [Solemya pervernicosa gill symbiont]
MGERLQRIKDKITRELGPIIRKALEDPEITEIMLNSDGNIWTEHFSKGMEQVGAITPQAGQALLATIASSLGKEITEDQPSIEGELMLDGTPRIAGSIPPKTVGPQLTIRKHASKVFTLDDYVDASSLTPLARKYLKDAVEKRLNIMVCGGTGSGKTTFANALINEISVLCPSDRLYILEDTREIQCSSRNFEHFKTSEAESMDALVISSLRHRPDRIIVGEVRDGAALSLLESWNTGHEGGISTIHARKTSLKGAFLRLEYLLQKALPGTENGQLIGEALDLIVTIEKQGQRRLITSITEVTCYNPEKAGYQTKAIEMTAADLIKKDNEGDS